MNVFIPLASIAYNGFVLVHIVKLLTRIACVCYETILECTRVLGNSCVMDIRFSREA